MNELNEILGLADVKQTHMSVSERNGFFSLKGKQNMNMKPSRIRLRKEQAVQSANSADVPVDNSGGILSGFNPGTGAVRFIRIFSWLLFAAAVIMAIYAMSHTAHTVNDWDSWDGGLRSKTTLNPNAWAYWCEAIACVFSGLLQRALASMTANLRRATGGMPSFGESRWGLFCLLPILSSGLLSAASFFTGIWLSFQNDTLWGLSGIVSVVVCLTGGVFFFFCVCGWLCLGECFDRSEMLANQAV